DLLPQFEAPRPFDEGKARDGARQMLWGLVKKVLIADNLAPVVEAIFHRPDAVDGPTALLGAGLFFVQIYGDFSGYSDIAIGSARLLGFDLSQNFALPFFSRDCTEFWRRWHITLNTWLRDYVFLTLEMGTRRRHLARRRALPPDRPGPRTPPAWRSAANLLLVFTLSGLWHGAAWTFVFWGFLNGLFLVPAALRRTAGATGPIAPGRWLPSLGELRGMVTTNLLIGLSLIFFRADSMGDAFAFFGALLTGPWLGFDLAPFVEPLALCGGLIVVEWLRRDRPHPLAGDGWSVGLRWATYCALILALIVRGSLASREFVYFQF
ncbi:MAG: MBOAT family protein, partial [Myxococcales bacterium]|nr:MBOAT family protein [Myxococcales bacterium]